MIATSPSEPRTKALKALIERLGVGAQKVLVLTDGVKQNVHLCGRNLPNVHVLPFSDASAYHVLWSDVVLIEGLALGHTMAPIAEKESAAPKKAKPAAKAAAEPATKRAPEGEEAAEPAAEPAEEEAGRAVGARLGAEVVLLDEGDRGRAEEFAFVHGSTPIGFST